MTTDIIKKLIHKYKISLCKLLFPSVIRNYQQIEYVSECRLKYLRHLIDLCYLYESRNEIFYKKFRESIKLNEIKKNCIINFMYTPEQIAEYIIHLSVLSGNTNINYDPTEIDKINLIRHISDRLSPQEMEIISLLAHGFTAKELNVIFGLKHHQSINVKIHRIRKKCFGKQYKT